MIASFILFSKTCFEIKPRLFQPSLILILQLQISPPLLAYGCSSSAINRVWRRPFFISCCLVNTWTVIFTLMFTSFVDIYLVYSILPMKWQLLSICNSIINAVMDRQSARANTRIQSFNIHGSLYMTRYLYVSWPLYC